MLIEDRIKRWRLEEPKRETETFVVLLCDAEEEIRRLRQKADSFDRAYEELHQTHCRTSATAEEHLSGVQEDLARAETEVGDVRNPSEGEPG